GNVAAVTDRPALEQNAEPDARKLEELGKRLDLMQAQLEQEKQDLETAKKSAAEAVNQRDALRAKIELLEKKTDNVQRDFDRPNPNVTALENN
ncbi:MAG: hypothetical protein JO076_15880, partial [Verrucomicrobia bacterium]|nr:hypothetical protein [Verrucomicrobiota bacterium]